MIPYEELRKQLKVLFIKNNSLKTPKVTQDQISFRI